MPRHETKGKVSYFAGIFAILRKSNNPNHVEKNSENHRHKFRRADRSGVCSSHPVQKPDNNLNKKTDQQKP